MRVNVESLVLECIRWDVTPCLHYTTESAHLLLMKMPADQRIHLTWVSGSDWQLVFDRKVVTVASFEDCVTALAKMFTPKAIPAREASPQ